MSTTAAGSARVNAILRLEASLRGSPAYTAALAIVLAASLALAAQLMNIAAHAERLTAFAHALPYAVVDSSLGPPRRVHFALIAVGLVQSGVLLLLYRAMRGREAARGERAVLALIAAAMVVVALRAPAMTGFDAYAYAGYAKLGSLAAAYTPPPVRFPGELGVVNDVWGTPLVPCYYGPLWVVLSHAVAGGIASLGGTILALRALEVLALAAIAFVLAAWRRDAALVALFALNPAVYALYVANAHNDLFAVALLLIGAAAARRAPLAAACAVAAAALIKIPFAVAALYVFAGRDHLARRALWVLAAIALAVGLSLLFGGAAYVHDLLARLHQTSASTGVLYLLTARAIKTGLLIVACVALAGAFVRGAVWRTTGWSFIALGSLTYPWYLIWSLPYAALRREVVVAVLVPLPFVAALMEPAFPHLGLGQLAMLAMLIAAAYELLARKPLPAEA
ncbi:MAG TPA: hypothetical protein VHS78_00115 [Candidatus Elarobacter sp.]|jgi:hypothetical protein|nr:hypothetical protein [Candidatus Elarobacter sp.]